MPLTRSQPPQPLQSALHVAESRLIGGRYQVLAELGRGGMGVVYRVRDGASGGELALKQLSLQRGSARAAGFESLFEREFYVLAQLAHPRVIAVHDYGHDPSGPYYTMELLDGDDLKSLAPLDVKRACALLIDVCSSLALLHARRLVHRDLSPRNIRCTRQGHAKLIDFGAMAPMGACSSIVGTPAFIAPEVVHSSELDARTDLFSLGATLYYALTGRSPFPARQLAELRELWSAELVPASRWAPNIPPALDALCAELLRIEPAQRPSSAYEVIRRLQTIAGIQPSEPHGAERAFLQTPALVGRDEVLRRFRHGVRRALHGEGGSISFESEGGLGRSRMLDACVLEAKTLGAVVLRAAAGSSAKAPLAAAQQLVLQLLQVQPEVARSALARAGVAPVLLEADGGALRDLGDSKLERGALQSALSAWLARVCDSHAVLIAVDDVHAIDEASIAFLAALALEAPDLRLVIAVSAELPRPADAPVALATLQQKCKIERLRALSPEETRELLAGVFGDVPNVQLTADRLFSLAGGKPRETLALAQHLVDQGLVQYDHGRWSLPSELDARALPASAREAFAARVRALPPLARRLAEAQALLGSVMRREDYAVLAPEADAAALNAAVLQLLERQILQSDAEFYRLSHRALADVLCELLEPAQRRERHLALYELYSHVQTKQSKQSNPYLALRHLLEAEQYDRAFALLGDSKAFNSTTELDATLRVGAERVIRTLEHALESSLSLRRPPRETHELRRMLCGMATRGDDAVYGRVSSAWLAQLELDSGLADYRALDPTLPAEARLQSALSSALARYAATPERERVYALQDAISNLGQYVVCSIVIAGRTRNLELIVSLPGLLEPFAPLSPILFALWQNARATHELSSGYPLRARGRWFDVYERLGQIPPDSFNYLNDIRQAAARGVASAEAGVGSHTALAWAEKFDADPVQRVDAMYFRKFVRLMHDDSEGVARFTKQMELLTLHSSARPYFMPLWTTELLAACALRDLAGVKRVIDAVEPLAARHPGWGLMLAMARGEFELLRGDASSAQTAFERALAHAQPDSGRDPLFVEGWAVAVAGLMSVAIELGNPAQARALGRRALEVCERRGFELHWFRIAQRLSVAEAKLDQTAIAAARIDQLIDKQRELAVRGVFLAQSYVIRTQIALSAHDAAGATKYAALAMSEPGGERLLTQAAQREPLLADARRAGVDLALAPTQFEASVFGTTKAALGPDAIRLRAALGSCPSSEARASRALELLCELTGNDSGHLYLVGADAELTLVAQRSAASPDADDLRIARDFFMQQIDDDMATRGVSQATRMLSSPGAAAHVDARGRETHLFTLTCKDRGHLVYIGLGVLQAKPESQPAPQLASSLGVLAEALLRAGDSAGVRARDME